MANDRPLPLDRPLDGDDEPLADVPPRAPAVERAGGETDGQAWCVGSQDVLFEAPVVSACDACGGPLPAEDDDEYAVAGQGVYLWARGDNVQFESVPLCPACASAIGVAALARIEIEEEEG